MSTVVMLAYLFLVAPIAAALVLAMIICLMAAR
jgi:hypothetical protein